MNKQQKQLVDAIETACRWESQAPKAGNVHPAANFENTTYNDFLRSATLTANVFAQIDSLGVAQIIFEATYAIQQEIGNNTNLGIILLLAPLAALKQENLNSDSVSKIIDQLGVEDCHQIYKAINLSQAGGLNAVENQDLSTRPTQTVREVMQLAQNRDTIARQYANNFHDIFTFGLSRLEHWWAVTKGNRNQAIVALHIDWMANYPDTLIARKCGKQIAQESASRAASLLKSGWSPATGSQEAFHSFDAWLRAEGNQRNPGTSADLIAACLFVALRKGII